MRMTYRNMMTILFMGNSVGKRRQGRPRKRWLGDVEE
jgi:hypothetical protein